MLVSFANYYLFYQSELYDFQKVLEQSDAVTDKLREENDILKAQVIIFRCYNLQSYLEETPLVRVFRIFTEVGVNTVYSLLLVIYQN